MQRGKLAHDQPLAEALARHAAGSASTCERTYHCRSETSAFTQNTQYSAPVRYKPRDRKRGTATLFVASQKYQDSTRFSISNNCPRTLVVSTAASGKGAEASVK